MKNKTIITLTFLIFITLGNITNAKHFKLENEVEKGKTYLTDKTFKTTLGNSRDNIAEITAQQGHASYIP